MIPPRLVITLTKRVISYLTTPSLFSSLVFASTPGLATSKRLLLTTMMSILNLK